MIAVKAARKTIDPTAYDHRHQCWWMVRHCPGIFRDTFLANSDRPHTRRRYLDSMLEEGFLYQDSSGRLYPAAAKFLPPPTP